MSNSHDTDALDALVMGQLYGELDDAESAALIAMLDRDPSLRGELSRLSGLREMLAEVPSHEPPLAISHQLLHEAHAHAGKTAAQAPEPDRSSWLNRMFASLAFHPALASAVTLVLVVGVAGSLYVRGAVEPEHAATFAPVELDTAAEPDELMIPVREAESAPQPAAPPAEIADAPETAEDKEFKVRALDELRASKLKKAYKQKSYNRRKDKAADTAKAPGKPRSRRAKGRVSAKTLSTAPTTTSAISSGGVGAIVLQQTAQTEKDERVRIASRESVGGYAAPPPKLQATPRSAGEVWAEGKHSKLNEAFASKDCRTTAALANDIFDRAPMYYDRNVAVTKQVKGCKHSVEKERNVRIARRRGKGGGGSGNANAAKKAARKRSAPVQADYDDAAAEAEPAK